MWHDDITWIVLARGCSDILQYDWSHNLLYEEEGRMTDETKLRKRARIILANTVEATKVQKVWCAVLQAQVFSGKTRSRFELIPGLLDQ